MTAATDPTKPVPGPYYEAGRPGAIYANHPQPVDHTRFRGFDMPEPHGAGGGYLIAESIPHDPTRKLLVAAPDLLDALEALTDWCRTYTSPTDANSPHTLLLQAVAALAKARGR